MNTLRSHFFEELAGIYGAEQRIAAALPKMRRADIPTSLKREILILSEDTQLHLGKIEQIFNCFGRVPYEVPHPSDDLEITDCTQLHAYHAALVMALQKADQYEIATYKSHRNWEETSYHCLLDWARRFGNAEAANFFEEAVEDDRKTRADRRTRHQVISGSRLRGLSRSGGAIAAP